jgi:UDP-2,3-diacylglucosamine pyrophosphatase LpxH
LRLDWSLLKRHTLVLSDVHLSQAHPEDASDPLWMRYRRREHHPDAEFAGLVEHLLATVGSDRIEVVFNGDVFDFDAPWVKDGTSSFDEFPPTDEGAAEQVRLILADHGAFFGAVAKLVEAGHEVTFLSGNHDLELYWPSVRRAIRDVIGGPIERVRFRAWFHLADSGIYFEHGSQYDLHNAVRHPAVPLTSGGDRLHPVLGKLAFRRTGSRMGYFNPYYEETFYMGLFGYLDHFRRFYATSRHRIGRTWLLGALRTAAEIWRYRHREERIDEGRAAVHAEVGEVTDEAIDATRALRTVLAEDTMLPVLRELWLDRAAFVVAGLAIFAIVALGWGIVNGAIALVAFVMAFVAYEVIVPKLDIRTYDSAPETVLSLFDIHRVRAICMGHTHRPFARFTEKGLYANSGSWCPAFEDQLCTKPVLARRPVLLLTTDDARLSGGLYWWHEGELTPDPEGTRA